MFEDYSYGIGESDGVVWCVWREQEHVAFGDYYVFELASVDNFEDHGATVLVKPFGGFVDVVVGSGIRAAYYLRASIRNEINVT